MLLDDSRPLGSYRGELFGPVQTLGNPRVNGYQSTSLIKKKKPPTAVGPYWSPTAGLCLGPCGGPKGVGAFSWARFPVF